MNNFRFFVAFCFLVVVSTHRPIYQVLQEEGDLLGFFPFDKNFDEGAKRFNTTSKSPPELLAGVGFTGGSARFNGVNSYLRVPLDITQQKYENFTFGCWARAYEVGFHTRWILSNDDLSFDRSVGIDSGSGRWGWSALSGQRSEGGLSVKTHTWQYIVVVYSKNEGKIFVDNKYARFNVTKSGGKKFFEIGRAPCCGQFWLGEIDNVFLFGNALTVGQVEEIRRRFIQERMMSHVRSKGELLAFFSFDGSGLKQLDDMYSRIKATPEKRLFQSVKGYNGNAIRLNGTQSISVELDISGGAQRDITIGLWARTEKLATNQRKALISIDQNNYDRFLGIDHQAGLSGYTAYNGRTALGGLLVKTNVWQFIAVSYNNKEREVTMVTDDQSKTGPYHISFQKRKTFFIGRSPCCNDTFWEGDIDNVFVMAAALKVDDLMAIRHAFVQARETTRNRD